MLAMEAAAASVAWDMAGYLDRGQVLVSGPGYEEARRVWNGAVDRHPALIICCSGPRDVAAVVRLAREQEACEKRLWHLGNHTLACAPDAEAALAKACQRLPPWFVVAATVVAQEGYAARGRPRKDAAPSPRAWQIQATLTRDPVALEREALRRAAFLVGTNLLDRDAWPDEAVIALYREQTVVEMDCTQMTSFVGHGTLISH